MHLQGLEGRHIRVIDVRNVARAVIATVILVAVAITVSLTYGLGERGSSSKTARALTFVLGCLPNIDKINIVSGKSYFKYSLPDIG